MEKEEEKIDLIEMADCFMEDFDVEFDLFQSYLKETWKKEQDVEWFAMDWELYAYLERMHQLINNIGIAFKELSKEKPPIKIILFARHYHLEHLFAMAPVSSCIKDTIAEYDKEIKKRRKDARERAAIDYLRKSQLDLGKELLEGLENLRERPFEDEVVKDDTKVAVNGMNDVLAILSKAYDVIHRYNIYDGAMLDIMAADDEEHGVKADAVRESMNEYVMEMAREMEKDEYIKLKNQVVLMKEKRSDKVTEEHWCRLLEYEERAMKMAAKRELKSCEDEIINEMYNEKEREAMDKESGVIGRMLEVFTDDELFDFDKLDERGKRPDRKSVEMVVRLMLRGNIIRSEMNEEVMGKYVAWKGGCASNVEPWIADFRRYVEPLRGHYAGRNFDGLWNELIKSNGEIRKRDGKVEIRLFDARSKDKVNSFDKGTLQRIVGYMRKAGMIEGATNKEVASYLEGEENVKACEAQIMFGLDRNTTIDEENTKKIKEIIANFR